MAAIAERHRRRFDADEYAGMVSRVRAVVAKHVPPVASIAVVSRGDEALLWLGPRTTVHFPRAASGAYAGHHPPDSAAAIAHLQELQMSGVRYLVVPATAAWWLDHYDGFAAHLDRHWRREVDDDACAIFTSAAPAGAVTNPAAATPDVDPAQAQRARRFLDALLPDDCDVLLAGRGWDGLKLPGRSLRRLEHGTGPSLVAVEAQRRAGTPSYLVVPLAEDMGWLGELLAVLEERHPALARRESLAAVFHLRTTPTVNHERVEA